MLLHVPMLANVYPSLNIVYTSVALHDLIVFNISTVVYPLFDLSLAYWQNHVGYVWDSVYMDAAEQSSMLAY